MLNVHKYKECESSKLESKFIAKFQCSISKLPGLGWAGPGCIPPVCPVWCQGMHLGKVKKGKNPDILINILAAKDNKILMSFFLLK